MNMNRRAILKYSVAGAVAATLTPTLLSAMDMGTPEPMQGHGNQMGHGPGPGTGTSAGFMHITNNGDGADTLIGGSTDIAEIVEIHTMEMDGDVMRMKELEDGLEIPPGETVVLERGGYHVMLININTDLHEGDEHTLTLEFANSGEVEVPVVVSNTAPEDTSVEFGDLLIEGAHLRPAPMLSEAAATPMAQGTGTSAGYMHITNNGSEADTLIGGSTDIAEIVEIHTMEMDGDVMRMKELEDGLEIPPGETVVLERGGYHVMLINITTDLHEGDEHMLTLEFANAGEVEIPLVVSNTAPEDASVEFGDLLIEGAHLRPAPMLSVPADDMDATPES